MVLLRILRWNSGFYQSQPHCPQNFKWQAVCGQHPELRSWISWKFVDGCRALLHEVQLLNERPRIAFPQIFYFCKRNFIGCRDFYFLPSSKILLESKVTTNWRLLSGIDLEMFWSALHRGINGNVQHAKAWYCNFYWFPYGTPNKIFPNRCQVATFNWL